MTDTPDMMERLSAYLAARDEQRRREVTVVFAAMTKRERALVHEVAVMANVRASLVTFGGGHDIEHDAVVVSDVIARCLDLPDLYPVLARIARRAGVR